MRIEDLYPLNRLAYSQERPFPLKDDYRAAIKYLASQSMWEGHFEARRHLKRQRCLLVDLERDLVLVFNPYNWQATEASSLNRFEPSEVLNGILIVSPIGKIDEIDKAMEEFLPALLPESPIFVIEEKGFNFEGETKERKQILKCLGVVKRTILTRPSRIRQEKINEFLIWRGRTPKERKPAKPVNLFEEGPDWRKRKVRRLLRRTEEEYRMRGYHVLNSAEIKAALEKSSWPHNEIEWLRVGFGVEIEAPCGCQWRITNRGVEIRTSICEAGCDGIAPEPPTPGEFEQEQIQANGTEGPCCGECGGSMVWSPWAAKGGKWVCDSSDCNSCGH